MSVRILEDGKAGRETFFPKTAATGQKKAGLSPHTSDERMLEWRLPMTHELHLKRTVRAAWTALALIGCSKGSLIGIDGKEGASEIADGSTDASPDSSSGSHPDAGVLIDAS